ncbi:MAG: hypothetical protein FJ091_16300 [Deltaproteobacteria bacterium]|nr:hypothetical protein [Deltaproteobacteria bacterium]
MRICTRTLWLAAGFALACKAQAYLPSELAGRWISDDPRYAGHSLSISPSLLTFEGVSDESFRVRDVDTLANSDGSTTYSVTYGADGEGDMELRLRLESGAAARLQLGDRPERWTRAPRDWGMR